jgi:hypothetical protein
MALTNTELAIVLVLWLIGWIVAKQLGRAITGIWQLCIKFARYVKTRRGGESTGCTVNRPAA